MDCSVAIVGCGYWGKNLVRNFYELGVLHSVCDASDDNISKIKKNYPGLMTYSDLSNALGDKDISAIVIATPAETHYQIAKQALMHDKHVFVEKPLSLSVCQGEELTALAKKKNKKLMVGHVLQYHPAVSKLKRLIADGDLGKVEYIYSNRLNFGKIRREENILWSFAPHDISVILSLVNKQPIKISATGSNYLHPNIADTTMSQLTFTDGVNAHIFVSWLHPFKEQKLVVVGDKQMAVFDDTQPWDSKLKLYPHKVVWLNQVPQAEKANGKAVVLEECEPLRAECQHFLDCIRSNTAPITDGVEGVAVLKVLNRLQDSLDVNGKWLSFEKKSQSTFIHPTAEVHSSVRLGENAKVWHHCNIMKNTSIGMHCSFGQNCVVGPNVTIGSGVKVQNNISIYDGVEIEDDVFLGPSMVFTNVTNPRSFIVRKNQFKKTILKKGCTIGANATVVCGTTLGKYCLVAAGAVITKDVKPFSLMAGVPARRIGWVSKAGNTISFDQNSMATDQEDGSQYKLEDNQVICCDEIRAVQKEEIT